MDAIWLKNYPPGVPAEVDVHEFASLKDMLNRNDGGRTPKRASGRAASQS